MDVGLASTGGEIFFVKKISETSLFFMFRFTTTQHCSTTYDEKQLITAA